MTAEKSIAPEQPTEVKYISKEAEPIRFDVSYIGGGWTCDEKQNDGRLIWTVPSDQAVHFERHHFFKIGRIVRK